MDVEVARITALELAIRALGSSSANSTAVIEMAEKFYEFLTKS